MATSTVHVHNSDGKLMGSGTAYGTDPWKTQAEATKKATEQATAEAADAIAKAIQAETKRLAAEEAAKQAPLTRPPPRGRLPKRRQRTPQLTRRRRTTA